MSSPHSTPPNSLGELTVLIQRARNGDLQALDRICDRMLPRVAGLARKRLGVHLPNTSASDVAINVLLTFCQRFEQGNFPDLQDGHSLWKLLARITLRKVADAYRHENTDRRGVQFTRVPDADEEGHALSNLASPEPDPALVVEMQDLLVHLLAPLPPRVHDAVVWRMGEGMTNKEIAERLRVSLATVEEMFRSVRERWMSIAEMQVNGPPPGDQGSTGPSPEPGAA